MNYRRLLIKLFTFLGGAYFALRFVLPEKIGSFQFGKYHDQISEGFVLLGAVAIGLGLVNLLMVHGSRLIYRRGGWINSAVLLFGLALMLLVSARDFFATKEISDQVERIGLLSRFSLQIPKDHEAGVEDVPAFHKRNDALKTAAQSLAGELDSKLNLEDSRPKARELNEKVAQGLDRLRHNSAGLDLTYSKSPNFAPNADMAKGLDQLGVDWRAVAELAYEKSTTKKSYNFLNEGLFMALGAAMFSLLGFYVASAAYRAFRIKSGESAFMMATALLVMLGQIPFGIRLWEGFPELRLWLLQVPSSAAARAIEIGSAVAGLVLAFRMWFSIESESFKR
jgi:hypothetical protein